MSDEPREGRSGSEEDKLPSDDTRVKEKGKERANEKGES